MAKLTEDQKASNKEASLLRQAAYHARLKEYRASEDADKLVVAGSPQQELMNSVDEDFNLTMKHRDEELLVIDDQLQRLTEQRKHIERQFSARLDEKKLVRNAAVNSRNRLVSELKSKTNELFGDISNSCGSSLGWHPPEGYVARYAAENVELIAKKKAAREREIVRQRRDF